MKHRSPRRAVWPLSSGRLSVGLAAVGFTCLGMAVVSPDAGPRAEAMTTPAVAVPAAATGPARPATVGSVVPSVAVPTDSAAAIAKASALAVAKAWAIAPPSTHPSSPAATTPAPESVAAPSRIRIPAIKLSAKVDEMGLQKDRTVEVPDDPWRTGWYGLGPRPGQPGSAVILGHVDSRDGLAVFGRLHELRPGDKVMVESPGGVQSTFQVVRLATYPNEKFPAAKVYAAPGPERSLNLVTCAGRYTRETGRQANLVVYTRLLQDTQTSPAPKR